MCTLEQLKLGLLRYGESEFTSKVNGFRKVVVSLAITSIVSTLEVKVNENRTYLESADYLHEGLVNTEKLYNDIRQLFDKEGKIIEHLPYFEDVTFTVADLDKLRSLIC